MERRLAAILAADFRLRLPIYVIRRQNTGYLSTAMPKGYDNRNIPRYLRNVG